MHSRPFSFTTLTPSCVFVSISNFSPLPNGPAAHASGRLTLPNRFVIVRGQPS